MWLLPLLIIGVTVALSIPFGYYLAWVMDGRYRAPRWLRWIEQRVDTGPQNWKQYAFALLLFTTIMFAVGFALLACQPHLPLNPDGKKMLAPSTIFNTVISFMTNTDIQHYSGEVHFSYFSQVSFVLWNMFLSASIGFCTLVAIIRGLRGDPHMGNYYLDMWRVVMYTFMPLSLAGAVPMLAAGVPMTLAPAAQVRTLEPGSMGQTDDGKDQPQVIARGPVAAIMPIKYLGTNGGGFFGANSAHPFENPTALTNVITCISYMLFPFSLVVMFGRMLKNLRHATVIYGVMMTMLVGMVVWSVYFDTAQPNPALTARHDLVYPQDIPQADGTVKPVWVVAHSGRPPDLVDRDAAKNGADKPEASVLAGLPVDQELGNLEGKELRFGTSAGSTFSALTTAMACGAVNCMHDSLNPASLLSPFTGMWLQCVFGGKGVGVINMLVYIIIAVFLAGLMVGRTPEYLGKKIEAREMKLAMLALLVHPILILAPTGIFAAQDWGNKSTGNPGAQGFTEMLYEFSSSSANNGSETSGLAQTWGFDKPEDNPSPPGPYAHYWDIAGALVILFSRYVPIVAPLALVGGVMVKKPTPLTAGTLRTDTFTFALFLLGTVLMVGALLFLPAGVLGPLAAHWGPLPFGG
ncbi:MAG TPA: potassium-transporting ATPase subunit KdpA [Gemmataceae bacterium]|jgi:K+-transporting ATPase ATPase A chain|nr:potassium-transporting ATPase subunit KdpA [Gemmataceae bacterium]